MPDTWKGSIHFSSYYFTIIITDTITHSQNLSHLSICKLDCKIPEDKILPFTLKDSILHNIGAPNQCRLPFLSL